MESEKVLELVGIGNSEKRRPILHSMGETYLQMAGYTNAQVAEIMGRVRSGDKAFWRAIYLNEEREGWESKWGMDSLDAFKCLVDVHRTSLLIDGISATVSSLERQGLTNIVAIDAGTGTGILAMALAAHPSVDKVIALEINDETSRIAPRFIEHFGLAGKIEVLGNTDATDSGLDLGNLRAAILVSENLSSALFLEPQYQIIKNLSRFTSNDVKILPHQTKCYAYLGSSAWEVEDEKENGYTIAARRLEDLQKLTPPQQYFQVTSKRGMPVPQVRGTVNVAVNHVSAPINVLLTCSDFQINEGPNPIVLKHDTAEFLGKSGAIRLPEAVHPRDGEVVVHLDYLASTSKKNETQVDIRGNEIFLTEKRT